MRQARLITAWATLHLFLPLCVVGETTTPPSVFLESLVSAIDARLQVATRVAQAKRTSAAPVLDAAREAAVLESVRQEAIASGYPPEEAVEFFRHQITASRLWQEHCLAMWKRGAALPAGPEPDLARDLRPQMDQATRALLKRWGACREPLRLARRDSPSHVGIRNRLLGMGYPQDVAQAAAVVAPAPPP